MYLSTTSIAITGLRLQLSFMPSKGFRLHLRVSYHNDISWPLLLRRLAPVYKTTYSTGEISGVKPVYATSKLLCPCCVIYDDKRPFGNDPEQDEIAESLRNTFSIVCGHHPVGESWKLECIWINNPDLREFLMTLFRDYPAIDCTSTELRFTQPFVPFLHRWGKFIGLVECEKEQILRENLEILRQILKKQLKEAFKANEVFEETTCVNFDQVPIAFIPGEVILNKKDGVISAALLKEVERVTSDDKKDACYRFRVNQLDWDGMNCGVRESTFEMEEFKGTLPLADMDILPLRCHPHLEIVRERLIARGRKFEKLRRQHFMTYNAQGREMLVHQTMMKASQFLPSPSKALTRTQGERAGDCRCQVFLRGFKGPQSLAQAFEWPRPQICYSEAAYTAQSDPPRARRGPRDVLPRPG